MNRNEKICFVGKTPLLMHSGAAIDPVSTDAQWLQDISKKRNKSVDDIEELYRREWHVNMYKDRGRPYIPLDNIHSCIYSAAKRYREGPQFVGSLIVTSADFKTDIIDDLDEAWTISRDTGDERSWVDIRPVRIGQSRLMRCRPAFKTWSMDVELSTDVDDGLLDRWLRTAGQNIGLCDYRPQKGGRFGSFAVEFLS